jgi:hypothetical protein
MQKIQLNHNQIEALIFLNDYYKNQEAGYHAEREGVNDNFNSLVELGLAFKTEGGFFPSTLGQDYLANISE